jgi:hypothetical protein
MNRFQTFYYQKIKPYFLQKPLTSNNFDAPFFILSAGRSGSTLLRKLLICRTHVNIPPESDDLIPKLIKIYLRYNNQHWEYIVRKCFEIYNQEPSLVYWNTKISEMDIQELISWKKPDQTLDSIIKYFYNQYGKKNNMESCIWGDKTPFLAFRLSWINLLYPSAKFIFIIRDSRAVVNSYLKMDTKYNLKIATNRWLKSIKEIEKQKNKREKGKVLFIKYEELVSETEIKIKEVSEFLDLPQRAEPLENIKMGDDVLDHHKNVRQEVSMEYISNWQRELSQDQVDKINKRTKSAMIKYGY